MRHVVSITMAIVVAHVLVAAALRAGTASGGDRSIVSAPPIVTNRTPDFSGHWKLDPRRSDPPPRPPGSDHGPGGPPGGSDGGAGGSGGVRPDHGPAPQGGPRPRRWPSRMHIRSTPDLVSVEDSAGFVLEQIAIGGAVGDTTGTPHFAGSWFGDSLKIEHPGPDGAKVAEIIALAEKGETLIIRTHLIRGNEQWQFKRVYRRAAK